MKASFSCRSNSQRRKAVRRINANAVNHMDNVKGFMKAQPEDFVFLIGTMITSPVSVYGCVKSTFALRSESIVISATTASNVWPPTSSLN